MRIVASIRVEGEHETVLRVVTYILCETAESLRADAGQPLTTFWCLTRLVKMGIGLPTRSTSECNDCCHGDKNRVRPAIASTSPLPYSDNGNNLENLLCSHRESLMAVTFAGADHFGEG
jgi:hypothetical protein